MFLAVVLAGLMVGWLLRSAEVSRATTGRQAPGFTVEVIGDQSFDLAEHLEEDGRPLILNLWASWCLPCRTEIPELSAFTRNRPDVRVLGVAVDDTEQSATSFAGEIEAAYPLALGNPEFEDAYPRLGLPVTYVIDAEGVVTQVYNGILDEETLADLVDG